MNSQNPAQLRTPQFNGDTVAVELVTRWVLRADESVEVYWGVFLIELENERIAVAEGEMRLLQPGESWAGSITADDQDGESVIVNVTFSN